MQKIPHLVTQGHGQRLDEVDSGKEFGWMGGAAVWALQVPLTDVISGEAGRSRCSELRHSIESQFQEIKPAEMRNPAKEPRLRFTVAPN